MRMLPKRDTDSVEEANGHHSDFLPRLDLDLDLDGDAQN